MLEKKDVPFYFHFPFFKEILLGNFQFNLPVKDIQLCAKQNNYTNS